MKIDKIIHFSTAGASSRAGGAGAGGSVLIKGINITLGTNLVTVAAGSGANGGDSGGPSNNGGVGRIHVDASLAISGSTTPSADTAIDYLFFNPPWAKFLSLF